MSPRALQILRMAIVAMVAGIVVLTALVVRQIATQDLSTPKTELDRAVFTAEESVKANPEDPAARVKLAAAYLERGNTTGAIEQGEIAVRLAPKEPTAYYVVGLAYSDRDDEAKALTNLNKAAGMKGQVAQFYQDCWVAIARVYEKSDKMDKSIEAMSKALGFGPENVVLLNERARLYERDKQWRNALDDYAAALEYVPDHESAREAFDRLKVEHPKEFQELQKLYGIETTTTGGN